MQKLTIASLLALLMFACTEEDNYVQTKENYLVKKDNEVVWDIDIKERDGVIYQAYSLMPYTGCFFHYDTPEIDFFRGCAVDGKLHGVYEKYWFNGQVKYRQESMHGELHGVREFFYQSGDLHLREHYKKGEMHGVLEWYDYEDGSLEYYMCYQNGELVDDSVCE